MRTYTSVNATQNRLAQAQFMCPRFRHLTHSYAVRRTGRPVRRSAYECVSCLNRGHMNWAWASLFWVAFTDVYVRMCSMGVWHDWRLL